MTRMSEPLDLTAWMTRWRMLPPPGGLILCAVSGGRDSVCLLDCLWKLGRARDFRVAAAHLNHGMRPTAQRDEDLVRALCAERNIPFYTETVDVYALCAVWRLTVEETGRRARYDFLRRTADALGADFIATAHHRDDQAETVLLQLLRGTGPQGLTGIPPVRDGIIRPLLDTPRAAIDDYIAAHGLSYVTDETNLDTHYARNRLRLDIMPQLLAINPAAVTHITRTADILRAENDLLDAQAAALLPPEGTTLPCAALLSAPEALRPRMLRLLTDRLGAGKKDAAPGLFQFCGGGVQGGLIGAGAALDDEGSHFQHILPAVPFLKRQQHIAADAEVQRAVRVLAAQPFQRVHGVAAPAPAYLPIADLHRRGQRCKAGTHLQAQFCRGGTGVLVGRRARGHNEGAVRLYQCQRGAQVVHVAVMGRVERPAVEQCFHFASTAV